MFKRIVTILKQLMGYPSIPASEPQVLTPSSNANKQRAKSGQASAKPRKSSPARTPRKPKQETAPSTTAARKPGKKKPTARQVAMVSQSKPTGSKSKTPASKTRQHAK
jgi:hypothetical protein